MKNRMYPFLFSILLIIHACVPVNSSFDSARMLEKGELGIRGNGSDYYYNAGGNTDRSNTNYGLAIIYGLNTRWNISGRYEVIDFPDNTTDFYHYAEIKTKFSILPNTLALCLPLGVYAAEEQKPVYVLSPQAMFTYPFNARCEITFSAKADLFLEKDDDIPIGLQAGLGLSSNLEKWALRPEIGYMIHPGVAERAFTYGVGLQYNFTLFQAQE
ncbi:MAG: hypothetical protein R2794_11420 [Chitinophagales bacterium]